MEFDTGVPVYPGALGYATPYAKTGTRIHILFDRVHNTAPPQLEGRLLGHVMAHELGHVLEGIDRHSAAGLMKAHWDAHDFGQMSFLPLAFSAFDVDLIQTGVARWAESSKPQRDSRGAARKNGPV